MNNQTLNQETDRSNPSVSTAAAIGLSKNASEGNLITTGTTGYENDYIKKWLLSLTILHHGHWDAARKYERINLSLGLGTALTAAVSGTTAFTQLQQQTDQGELTTWIQILVGLFALTAATLGAAQAFVRPSEIAARHKKAGQKYGTLRREIELQLYLGIPVEAEKLTDFRLRWDAVDEESLPVPQRIYDRTEKEYKNIGFRYESQHSGKHSTRKTANQDDNGRN